MFMEGLFQELNIPKGNSPMGKGGTSAFAKKCTLNARHLILEVLRLLAVCTLGGIRAHTFDRVTEAFDIAFESVTDDGEIRGQEAVIVDENCIFEILCGIAAYKLSDDFGADGDPEVVDAKWLADLFCVIERCFGVSICDDEDVLFGEYFERGLQSWADYCGRFITWD